MIVVFVLILVSYMRKLLSFSDLKFETIPRAEGGGIYQDDDNGKRNAQALPLLATRPNNQMREWRVNVNGKGKAQETMLREMLKRAYPSCEVVPSLSLTCMRRKYCTHLLM